ncbi:MAG: LysE family translocator [Acidimicrobiia bacterium]
MPPSSVFAIVLASATAFTAVKIAGGLYLILLGIRSWRTAGRIRGRVTPTVHPTNRLFAEGFVVNLFNPKVLLFFLAFLPQFVERGRGPIWSQTLVLGLVYMSLGLLTDSAYAISGARLGGWFSGRDSAPRACRFAEGGLLVGLGVLTIAGPAHRNTKPTPTDRT